MMYPVYRSLATAVVWHLRFYGARRAFSLLADRTLA